MRARDRRLDLLAVRGGAADDQQPALIATDLFRQSAEDARQLVMPGRLGGDPKRAPVEHGGRFVSAGNAVDRDLAGLRVGLQEVGQEEIGRESCEESVGQYVYIQGVGVTIKKKKR